MLGRFRVARVSSEIRSLARALCFSCGAIERVSTGGGESEFLDFIVNCKDFDHRHQCLLMIEAGWQGRQTANTSEIGLSFHRRQGAIITFVRLEWTVE